MEGVDISHFSEEEQKILLSVFAREKDEEERDLKNYRQESDTFSLLKAAVALRRREQSGVDSESTCQICFKTKFADGIGHICHRCEIRCCARCGVKVPLRHKKIWLCLICRKEKELEIRFGKLFKSDPVKSWGRSRSLEEEAQSQVPLMKKNFPSSLSIHTPSLPFFNIGEKKQQQQPAVRPDPLPPSREELHPSRVPQLRCDPPQLHPNDGGLQRRYTRRRSSLDTIRNDSLSSDQSENPPAAPRPKPRKGNGHRYRRSGSSGSEDEARSSPSSCQDSESDRGTGHRRHPQPEPLRPPNRRRWEDSGIDTSSSATLNEETQKVSDFMDVSNLISTGNEIRPLCAATNANNNKLAERASRCLSATSYKFEREQYTTDKEYFLMIDRLQGTRQEDQFDITGRNVAVKLRTLPKAQRIMAEKLINEVLFEAELGTLNRNSKVNVM